jgi:hypothetical protein
VGFVSLTLSLSLFSVRAVVDIFLVLVVAAPLTADDDHAV